MLKNCQQPHLSGFGLMLCFLLSFVFSAPGHTQSVAVSGGEALSIERRLVRRGFERAQDRVIDTIVLHSVYNPFGVERYSIQAILNIFQRERVAAHYIIDREGRVYQLVREGDIAFHAGRSQWHGRSRVSRFSLGIELMNHPSDRYTEAQYQSLNRLLRYIQSRYNIRSVVAHREIAPQRRSDPWNFDWSRIIRP